MLHALYKRLAAGEIVTTQDAARAGLDRNRLHRLVSNGRLRRLHNGAYVASSVWEAADAREQHVLRCRAVLTRYDDVVVSHASAVLVHGLATFAVDAAAVHLSRCGAGRTGRRGKVDVHVATPPESWSVVEGMPVVSAPVAALQVADRHGFEAGMVAAEDGLHRRLFTTDDLRKARLMVRPARGTAVLDRVVELADALSESPGETRTKVFLHAVGLTSYQQQAHVRLRNNRRARVDFLLPDLAVALEYDGAVKYGGADGPTQLVEEKRREELISETGLRVVRLIASDLSQPTATYQRIIGHR